MIYLKIVEIIILTVLPTFLWLRFFRDKDLHQEPLYLLRRVFIFGFLSTPLIALIEVCANQNIAKVLNGSFNFFNCSPVNEKLSFFEPSGLIIIIFIGAFIEELFKFLSMRLAIFGNAKKEFDEPVDSMVYLITAALGFATAENLSYAFKVALETDFLNSSFLNYQAEVLRIIAGRSLISTLLHTLSSGIFGYFFAKAYFHFQTTKFYYLRSVMVGLFFSTLIHFSFNLIIRLGSLNNQNNIETIIQILGISLLLFFSYIILVRDFKKLQLT